MEHVNASNISELLAQSDGQRPQAIVGGWFLPDGRLVSTAFTACEKVPTHGEHLVAWAACLAACLKKIDEMVADSPEQREQLLHLVEMTVGDLELVKRLTNDHAAKALALNAATV